jgi:3',5'-cyclic AMP phosphodiesterase CpdA
MIGRQDLYTLAHVSDWHTTPLTGLDPRALLSKRFFGWLSWNLRREKTHRPEVLRALFEDLHGERPDQVAMTGDLTNIALEQECQRAAALLRELGGPDWISLIPGNHDAYVPVPVGRSWKLWADYIRSDPGEGDPGEATGEDFLAEGVACEEAAPFPCVRTRGELALVGVCTARPTPLFMATGRVGDAQLRRLEERLFALGERGLCRVVLVHHPVVDHHVSPRRRLSDSGALRRVLERAGAELVLHGHHHRSMLEYIEGPEAPIPVVGVRSSSDVGEKEHKRAQYNIYGIERETRDDPASKGRFRIEMRVRGWDPQHERFVAEGCTSL